MNKQKILLMIVMLIAIIVTVFACTNNDKPNEDSGSTDNLVDNDNTGAATYPVGSDTMDTEQETTENPQDTEKDLARQNSLALARTELHDIREEIKAGTFSEENANKVAKIRENLRLAYADAKAETRESWEEIDVYLEKLEDQIRRKSDQALETLDKILEEMQVD
jgi:hypothetical protein